MLPMVQRHQMVHHHTPHLDARSPYEPDLKQQHDHFSFPQHVRNARPALPGCVSSHRAFPIPIRASQPSHPPQSHPRPSAFRVPSHLSDHNEHHLRRKTPNGTIDAGYDGSPAQLASGPPPLKHMILPASNNSTPNLGGPLQNDYHSLNQQSMQSTTDSWTYQPAQTFTHQDHNAPFPVDTNLLPLGAGWPPTMDSVPRSAVALDCAPNPQPTAYFPYNNGVRVPTALQPVYQQSPGPAVFNNGGLLPVPAWPEMNMPLYQNMPPPGAQPYHSLNRHQPMLHAHPSDPLLSGVSLGADSRLDPGAGHFQVPSRKLESLTLESSRYSTPGTHLQENVSPARFRAKAFTNAHRAYLELLTYLQQSKKSQGGRSSSRLSSKMVILPKLPKASLSSAYPFHRHSGSGLAFNDMMDNNYGTNSPHHVSSDLHRHAMMNQSRANDISTPAFYHLFSTENSRYTAIDKARSHGPASPLTSAKAALEMLTHMCEHSGWTWVDGILLGGCLHYGLEHYEQALEWFSRIVALDAEYVTSSSFSPLFYALVKLTESFQAHRSYFERRRIPLLSEPAC